MTDRICIEQGCPKPVRSIDRCTRHYNAWLRKTPKDSRPRPSLKDRILSKVEIDQNGCWIWQGCVNHKGYGQVRHSGKVGTAHRAAYEAWGDEVPDGHTVDHLCRIRSCVNPDHLEAVPHRENLMRGTGFASVNASKSHCPQGHPYSGDNLILKPGNGYVGRVCRTCRDERNRARYRG